MQHNKQEQYYGCKDDVACQSNRAVFISLDSSNEDDDYFEDDDNMFSRLEETRAKLESELGCETFLKAYKTVQV